MNFLYFFFQLGVGILFIFALLFGLFVGAEIAVRIQCKRGHHNWKERDYKHVGDMTIVGGFKKCKECGKEEWKK